MKKEVVEEGTHEGLFAKRPWIPLTVLVVYVALLALGTAGEVFKIQWILDLPIFKGP